MADLKTILDNLEDSRLDYVMARSKSKSTSEALRISGINRTVFYKWDEAERNNLDDIAQRLKRETAVRALLILQNAVEEAARVKTDGLKSRDERVKQAASTEILDRAMGKNEQPAIGEFVIHVDVKNNSTSND